jgi:hypothetical protein
MINTEYEIDYSDWFDEGGYCQVYPIKNNKDLIFKEFYTKTRAIGSYRLHKKLAKFDLAPKIYSKVCKLNFAKDEGLVFDSSDWGYIIERAKICEPNTGITLAQIQVLVSNILDKTGLKFWDCHWYNIGLVKRGRSKKLVCIDTGRESFDGDANAWGNVDPGPQCGYCLKYNCKC